MGLEDPPDVGLLVAADERDQHAALLQLEESLLELLERPVRPVRSDPEARHAVLAHDAAPQRPVAVHRHHLGRRDEAAPDAAGDLDPQVPARSSRPGKACVGRTACVGGGTGPEAFDHRRCLEGLDVADRPEAGTPLGAQPLEVGPVALAHGLERRRQGPHDQAAVRPGERFDRREDGARPGEPRRPAGPEVLAAHEHDTQGIRRRGPHGAGRREQVRFDLVEAGDADVRLDPEGAGPEPQRGQEGLGGERRREHDLEPVARWRGGGLGGERARRCAPIRERQQLGVGWQGLRDRCVGRRCGSPWRHRPLPAATDERLHVRDGPQPVHVLRIDRGAMALVGERGDHQLAEGIPFDDVVGRGGRGRRGERQVERLRDEPAGGLHHRPGRSWRSGRSCRSGGRGGALPEGAPEPGRRSAPDLEGRDVGVRLHDRARLDHRLLADGDPERDAGLAADGRGAADADPGADVRAVERAARRHRVGRQHGAATDDDAVAELGQVRVVHGAVDQHVSPHVGAVGVAEQHEPLQDRHAEERGREGQRADLVEALVGEHQHRGPHRELPALRRQPPRLGPVQEPVELELEGGDDEEVQQPEEVERRGEDGPGQQGPGFRADREQSDREGRGGKDRYWQRGQHRKDDAPTDDQA